MRLSIEGVVDTASRSPESLREEEKKIDEHYNSMTLTVCAIIEHKELIQKGIEDTIDGRKVVGLFGSGPRPDRTRYMFYKPLQELAWIEKQWNEEQK